MPKAKKTAKKKAANSRKSPRDGTPQDDHAAKSAPTTNAIVRVPVDQLHFDPANVRRHNERNLDAIAASLARFGQVAPIVATRDSVVRKGNGTLAAAIQLGWSAIDVIYTDLTGSDAIAFAIADNRTAELAEWDEEALAHQLNALAEDDDIDTLVTGFNADELKKLTAALEIGDATAGIEQPDTTYEVIVTCDGEADQQSLYERLHGEGLKVRVLTV